MEQCQECLLLTVGAEQTEQALVLFSEDLLCPLSVKYTYSLKLRIYLRLAMETRFFRRKLVLRSLCWNGSLHTG
jgi:hypothetical protein